MSGIWLRIMELETGKDSLLVQAPPTVLSPLLGELSPSQLFSLWNLDVQLPTVRHVA